MSSVPVFTQEIIAIVKVGTSITGPGATPRSSPCQTRIFDITMPQMQPMMGPRTNGIK